MKPLPGCVKGNVILLLMVCGGLLIFLGWHGGSTQAERLMSKLRLQGEVFTVEELGIEPTRSRDTLLELMQSLEEPFHAFQEAGKAVSRIPQESQAPGVRWQPDQLHSCRGFSLNWVDAELHADRIIPSLGALQAALREAPAQGCPDEYAYVFTRTVTDFGPWWMTAQVLSDLVMVELHRERRAAAFANLLALLHCAQYSRDNGTLAGQCTRMSIARLAVETMWHALQFPGWTDDELRTLQDEFANMDLLGTLPRVFEVERVLALSSFVSYRDGGLSDVQSLASQFGRTLPPIWMQRIHYTHWRTMRSRDTEWITIRSYQALIDRHRQLAQGRAFHDLPPSSAPRQPSWLGQQLDAWVAPATGASMLPLYSDSEFQLSATEVVLDVESERRLAITALALRRHHLGNGSYPQNLNNLAPRFVAAVPVSPWDGQPVRYRREGKDRFLLAAPQHGTFDQPPGQYDAVWLAAESSVPELTEAGSAASEVISQIEFDEAPLIAVVQVLARQAGLDLEIGPGLEDLEEVPISLLMVDITAREVLDMVLNSNDLRLIEDRFTGRYWVVQSP